jgi:hypothetical protein
MSNYCHHQCDIDHYDNYSQNRFYDLDEPDYHDNVDIDNHIDETFRSNTRETILNDYCHHRDTDNLDDPNMNDNVNYVDDNNCHNIDETFCNSNPMSTEQLLPAKSPIDIHLQELCAGSDAIANASLETPGSLREIILYAVNKTISMIFEYLHPPDLILNMFLYIYSSPRLLYDPGIVLDRLFPFMLSYLCMYLYMYDRIFEIV